MILTTTSSIEGKVPTAYLGVLGAEVIFGATFIKDWLAEGADFWGGRAGSYESTFEDARNEAMKILEQRATARGANAVLNIRFDYSVLGANNGMLMVAATGTAVVLVLSAEEKRRNEALEREASAEYFVSLDGKERGPFSIIQLRDLVQSGKVPRDAMLRTEEGSNWLNVSELI